MEEINNSNAYREQKERAAEAQAQRLEKTSTEVRDDIVPFEKAEVKKKTFGDKARGLFIKEDGRTVLNYVCTDILLPAFKNTIYDMVQNGLSMMIFGEPRTRSNSRPVEDCRDSRVRMQRYRDLEDRRDSRQDYRSQVATYDYDQVVYDDRGRCEALLAWMQDRISKWRNVSVAEMYQKVNWSGWDYTANNYGWYDLRDATVIRLRDGRYWLRLPDPVVL